MHFTLSLNPLTVYFWLMWRWRISFVFSVWTRTCPHPPTGQPVPPSVAALPLPRAVCMQSNARGSRFVLLSTWVPRAVSDPSLWQCSKQASHLAAEVLPATSPNLLFFLWNQQTMAQQLRKVVTCLKGCKQRNKTKNTVRRDPVSLAKPKIFAIWPSFGLASLGPSVWLLRSAYSSLNNPINILIGM